MDRGLLIVFEGLDGSGKSTQLDLLFSLLCEKFRGEQQPVISTKEPSEGPVGRRIRAMARSGKRVSPALELEWFMQDRREHVRKVVEPGLAQGAIVLCDRYWLSNVAYQSARGLDPAEILRANRREFPDPDLALIFELSAAEGLARVHARGGISEPAFEELAFLNRVEKIYQALDLPWVERINAGPGVSAVHAAVVDVVFEKLPELGSQSLR